MRPIDPSLALTRGLLCLAFVSAACSGDEVLGPLDAAGIDAIDAPAPDAPVDAAEPDAIDAAVDAIDAPMIDAPTDAPAIDAPADAPVSDALDPLGFPLPQSAPRVAIGNGQHACNALGFDHLAWVSVTDPDSATAWFDHAAIGAYDGIAPGACRTLPLAGSLVYAFLFEGQLRDWPNGRSVAVANLLDLIGADPAGGLVFVDQLGSTRRLGRLTPAFTIDGAFGSIPLSGTIHERLLQDGAAPIMTLLIDNQLHRRHRVTGAPIAAFGGTGVVALPPTVSVGHILGFAPLPDDGLAIVSRVSAAIPQTWLQITRIDAAGVVGPLAYLDAGVSLEHAVGGTDAAGRVTIAFPFDGGSQRLIRIDPATGALDPGFGAGGRMRLTVEPTPCPPGTVEAGTGWNFRGVLGDGRVAYTVHGICGSEMPLGPTTYFAAWHLW